MAAVGDTSITYTAQQREGHIVGMRRVTMCRREGMRHLPEATMMVRPRVQSLRNSVLVREM